MQAARATIRPMLILGIGGAATVWLVVLSALAVLCFTSKGGCCTTWGCSPAFKDLPLFHATWLVALLPPMLFVAFYGPPKLVRFLAATVALFGVGLGGYDTFTWAAERGQEVPVMEYLQRWGYRLLTSVINLPLLAIPLSACLAWCVANRRIAASSQETRVKKNSVFLDAEEPA